MSAQRFLRESLQAAGASVCAAASRARQSAQPCVAAAWSATRQPLRSSVAIKDYPKEDYVMKDGSPLSFRLFIVRSLHMAWARVRRIKLLVAIPGGALVLFMAWQLLRNHHPDVTGRSIEAAFEAGYVPARYTMPDAQATVVRPSLHAQLLELLRPHEIKHYALVVGSHGTGKVRFYPRIAMPPPLRATTPARARQ